MDDHVRIGDLTVVQEAACRGYLGLLWIRYPQDLLVQFGPLVVSNLPCLPDCLPDVPGSEAVSYTHLTLPTKA